MPKCVHGPINNTGMRRTVKPILTVSLCPGISMGTVVFLFLYLFYVVGEGGGSATWQHVGVQSAMESRILSRAAQEQ